MWKHAILSWRAAACCAHRDWHRRDEGSARNPPKGGGANTVIYVEARSHDPQRIAKATSKHEPFTSRPPGIDQVLARHRGSHFERGVLGSRRFMISLLVTQ